MLAMLTVGVLQVFSSPLISPKPTTISRKLSSNDKSLEPYFPLATHHPATTGLVLVVGDNSCMEACGLAGAGLLVIKISWLGTSRNFGLENVKNILEFNNLLRDVLL